MSEIDLRATSLQGNVVALGARESRASAAYITPMAATAVGRLPEGKDWLYEVKFDGYRALVIKQDERVRLLSRNNHDLSRSYPAVHAAGLRLRARSAVVDGE